MNSNKNNEGNKKPTEVDFRLAGFESIFTSADQGVILLDNDGFVVEFNSEAKSLLGIKSKGESLQNVLEAFDSFNSRFLNRIMLALKKRVNLEDEDFCTNLNKWIYVRFSNFNIGTIAYFKDVTEQKEYQKYVEELARFPEETWNPVMKFNIDGTIVYVNSRCDAILESWGTQLHGKLPTDVTAKVKKSIETNSAQEVEVLCKNDQIYSILLAPVPEANATYVYGRDVTLLKQNEKELIEHRDHLEELVSSRTKQLEISRDEAERANKAKSIFLANMSHEIRTPLAAIIGFAESLLDPQPEKELHNAVHTIIRSGNHLTNIVNNILDLSKIEAEKVELESLEVSIFEILSEIQSILEAQTQAKGIAFDIDYQYPLPQHIVTDPVRLKQILINLCNNAIKFTSQGGIKIGVSCQPKQERMTFKVIDSGIGMTPAQTEKIFQPFAQADSSTTRKYGGTGLGLTLSKQFAKLLGGDLGVESVEGKGSTFIVEVSTGSLDSVEFTSTQTHREKESSRENTKVVTLCGKVLLVEDTPELQILSTNIIKKTGASVDLAENGEIAIKKAIEGNYDVILMDMQMPVLDGYEATRFLRRQNYNKPIVAMTANTMKQDKDKAIDSGCDDFVGKPINRNELYRVLSNYIGPSDQTVEEAPLKSNIIEDEPELREVIENFLSDLPKQIQTFLDNFHNQEWETLKSEMHDLKAIGGGLGYPEFSIKAEEIEIYLKNDTTDSIEKALGELEVLAQRAISGLNS